MIRRSVNHLAEIIGNEADLSKDEKFLRRNLVLYAERLVARYPSLLRDDFLRFLWFVLDPPILAVGLNLLFELAEFPDDYDYRSRHWTEPTEILDEHDFARAVGEWIKHSDKVKSEAIPWLFLLLEEAEDQLDVATEDAPVERRIRQLASMFKLTDNDVALIQFLFVMETYDEAETFFRQIEATRFRGIKYLSCAIGQTQSEIQQTMKGKLSTLGIIQYEHNGITLDTEVFAPFLRDLDCSEMTKTPWFSRIDHDPIPLEDHFVDASSLSHVLNLLRVHPEKTSTSVLIYGPPGCGKTSFAVGLCRRLQVPCWEICPGKKAGAKERLAALWAALNMHGDSGVIVVDEADKLLASPSFWRFLGDTMDKKQIHDVMETPGRVIYICNDVGEIEPSILRRFAFSLKFRSFSRSQRVTFIQNVLATHGAHHLMADEQVTQLAKNYPDTAPAIVDSAVMTAMAMGSSDPDEFQKAVTLQIEAHQELAGRLVLKYRAVTAYEGFSLDAVNIDMNGGAQALVEQMKAADRRLRDKSMKSDFRFHSLFYGKSGTGKSALGRHIADLLDRECIEKRASDILHPYVGMTERLVREAFSEAGQKGAVLIMDEFDALCWSREKAVRSFEASLTSELLQSLETFYGGILIATTNRLEDLDQAVIRRFNVKCAFDCLTIDQSVILYRQLLAPLTAYPLTERIGTALKGITDLTPGDFKIVKDRLSLLTREEVQHEDLVDALRNEVAVKLAHSGSGHPMGFTG